ncbi:MAG: GPP34 family phosphoprotein [Aphanocapsa lilacina HA4352-LM1]|jgi:hypothetical protein|nr:GPP34 family phosphoprotein [Aphanocapsa lilacina HA4352-LM1]
MTIEASFARLTPAEALVLLDPDKVQGASALKVTLMDLIARGRVRVREEEHRGFLGFRSKLVFLHPNETQQPPADDPAHIQAVFEVLHAAQKHQGRMEYVILEAANRFSAGMYNYQMKHVRPALIARGLIASRQEKMLRVFTVTRHGPTPLGEQIQTELRGRLEQARALSTRLKACEPVEAAALLVSLGSAVWLVPDLKPHYRQLNKALRAEEGIDMLDLLDLVDVAFDALDAFDAGFDASGGGGDGGGDGGD